MATFENFRTVNWFKRINRSAQVVLSITLVAGLNYAATRHFKRLDLSRDHLYSLSPETLAYVKQLEDPIEIIVTIPSDAEEKDLAQVHRYLRNLLREYAYAGKRGDETLISARFVNIYKEITKADEFARRIGLNQPNVVLVVSGEKQRILLLTDIVELRNGVPTAFLGEQAITSAIMEVSSVKQEKVYFLVGHGEMGIDDVDPRRGLSQLREALLMRNFALATLDLTRTENIPEDADLIVVPSPQGSLMPQEVEKLRVYLSERAGRLIALLDPWRKHGMDDLLYEWGIQADDMLIVETGSDFQETSGDLLIRRFAEHPVTDFMLKNQIPIVVGLTRPVRSDPGAPIDERLTSHPLMASSESSWAERNYRKAKELKDLRYDPSVDLKGPVSIAAVSERKVSSQLGIQFSGGRLVVFGNSDLIANQRLSSIGNFMLFLNSVNWSLDRDKMLAVTPRAIDKFQLVVSRHEINQLGIILMILPGLVSILGLMVSWIRRN